MERVDQFQDSTHFYCINNHLAWKNDGEYLLNQMVSWLLLVISILYISFSLHNMACADMYNDCNESEQSGENSSPFRKNYASVADDCKAEKTVKDTSAYSKFTADMPADCNADCKFNGGSSCFFRDVSRSDLKTTNMHDSENCQESKEYCCLQKFHYGNEIYGCGRISESDSVMMQYREHRNVYCNFKNIENSLACQLTFEEQNADIYMHTIHCTVFEFFKLLVMFRAMNFINFRYSFKKHESKVYEISATPVQTVLPSLIRYNKIVIPVLLQINMHLLCIKWIGCEYLLAYMTFMHLCYLRHCMFVPDTKEIQYNEKTDKLQFDMINDTNPTVSLSKKSAHWKPQFSCQVLTDSSIDLSIRRNKQYSEVKDDEKQNLRQNTALPDSQNSYYYHVITVAIGGQDHNNPNNKQLQHSNESLQTDELLSQAESSQLQNQQTASNEPFRIDSDGENLSVTSHEKIDIVTDASESKPLNVCKDLKETYECDTEDSVVQKQSSEKLYSSLGAADGAWGGASRGALLATCKYECDTEDSSVVQKQSSEKLYSSLGAADGAWGGASRGALLATCKYECDTEDSVVQKQSSKNLYSSLGAADGARRGTSKGSLVATCTEESNAQVPFKSLPASFESAPLESSNQENELQYSDQAQAPEPLHEVFPTPAVDDSEIQRFEPMMAIIDKIAVGERVPPQITMRYEMLRFCTLRSFPKENKPFITRIAQAGFYYANTRDEVVCYCCAKRKSDWQETDVPLEVHRQLNPNCRFLNHNSEVNVSVKKQEQLAQGRSFSAPGLSSPATNPLIAATAAAQTSEANRQRNIGQSNQFSASTNEHTSTALFRTQTSTTLSQPTTTLSVPQGISQSRPLIAVDRPHGNFSAQSLASSLSTTHSQSVGINSMASTVTTTTTTTTVSSTNSQAATVRPPKYPAYATQAQRDASFRDCSELVVPASSLAEAGFFYAGFGDCCRCFQCGVGLRHWSAEDDPWIEHSRWSKNCAFVKEKKGEEFVNLVQMAIEYQQNNQQQQQQNTTGTGTEAGSGNDLEHLLHTDAAQSVLEMGYSPTVIQRAIRECIDTNGGTEFTAAMLMEKIFAFEESSAPPRIDSPAANPPVSNRVSTSLNAHKALSEPQGSGETASRDSSHHTASVEGAGASMATSQLNTNDNQSKRSQLREQKKLKEENERLKQQSICTQCKQNGVSIVFLPCGHLVTCEQCAEKVRYCTERNCGKYIKGTVRTYVA